jgi:transcriptional regulator with XRE-family HTH domain
VGRSHRPIPKGLSDKLQYVRVNLNFTQKQMFDRLQSGLVRELDEIKLHASHISEYEKGTREPPLRVLLEYARIAQLPMEILVDPELFIPNELSLSLIVARLHELGPQGFWAMVRRAQDTGKEAVESHETGKNSPPPTSKRAQTKKPK